MHAVNVLLDSIHCSLRGADVTAYGPVAGPGGHGPESRVIPVPGLHTAPGRPAVALASALEAAGSAERTGSALRSGQLLDAGRQDRLAGARNAGPGSGGDESWLSWPERQRLRKPGNG